MTALADLLITACINLFFFNFALDEPPGHKIKKELRIILFKMENKSFLCDITFSLDDDYKPVDFIGETISFTCQLIKI